MNDSCMCVCLHNLKDGCKKQSVSLYFTLLTIWYSCRFSSLVFKAFVVVSEEASIQTCWNKDHHDDDGQQAGPAGGPISCSHAEMEEYCRMYFMLNWGHSPNAFMEGCKNKLKYSDDYDYVIIWARKGHVWYVKTPTGRSLLPIVMTKLKRFVSGVLS